MTSELFGKRCASVKVSYSDGEEYSFSVKKGRMEGPGKMTYLNGDIYEGLLVNGLRSGNGTMTYSNGDVYEGDFVDNQRSGKGKMTYRNGKYRPIGNVYEGDLFFFVFFCLFCLFCLFFVSNLLLYTALNYSIATYSKGANYIVTTVHWTFYKPIYCEQKKYHELTVFNQRSFFPFMKI